MSNKYIVDKYQLILKKIMANSFTSTYKFLTFDNNTVSIVTESPLVTKLTMWCLALITAIFFYVANANTHPGWIFEYVISPGVCIALALLPMMRYKTIFYLKDKLITHKTTFIGIPLKHASLNYHAVKFLLVHKYLRIHNGPFAGTTSDKGMNLFLSDQQDNRYLVVGGAYKGALNIAILKLKKVVDIEMPDHTVSEVDDPQRKN